MPINLHRRIGAFVAATAVMGAVLGVPTGAGAEPTATTIPLTSGSLTVNGYRMDFPGSTGAAITGSWDRTTGEFTGVLTNPDIVLTFPDLYHSTTGTVTIPASAALPGGGYPITGTMPGSVTATVAAVVTVSFVVAGDTDPAPSTATCSMEGPVTFDVVTTELPTGQVDVSLTAASFDLPLATVEGGACPGPVDAGAGFPASGAMTMTGALPAPEPTPVPTPAPSTPSYTG